MAARAEIARSYAQKYAKAPKALKSLIRDEVCGLTRWSRDNARRRLTARAKEPPGRRGRKPGPRRGSRHYSYASLKVLQKVWAVSGGQCGKHLAAAMEALVANLERHGHLVPGEARYSAEVRAELLAMSPATIDRYLAPAKARDPLRGKSATRPGTMLRNSITVRVVRVGGVDVRDQSTEDLMAQLALVFQDVYLFDDTLRENIRLGRPDATDAEVDEAARLAGVTEIAERLPDGWDTRVGEAGSALSGGERQRVSVARAILKRAPVVLLDEATAALDPENERFVQRSLEALREHATLVVIAHKLSTVTGADQIIVLDDQGRIAEMGTHDELLALGGRYSAFWLERTSTLGWRLEAADTPA
ncbi:MAG: ATP-binding cassette domain-containing protein [Bifidobacteriaceae bacterium]|nr:ATP-binding cassette domain-containing protein [Bifidobacteriaceae bacterium]